MEKLFVSINDAAAILGLGRQTTRRLVQEGRIPSVRVGRVRRVPRQALQEVVANPKALSFDDGPSRWFRGPAKTPAARARRGRQGG
jgi:excisionase family DNA binding protein